MGVIAQTDPGSLVLQHKYRGTSIDADAVICKVQPKPVKLSVWLDIMEGYDGLAVLSTKDARQGLVELHYPPENEKDLNALLAEVSSLII